jgi:Lar family restriction alleviation protein
MGNDPVTTLLRCPFCGGDGLPDSVIADNGEARYFIRCRSCACEGPWARSATGAIHWWNMRTKQEAEVS